MDGIVDLDRYPLDREGSPAWQALVARCRAALAAEGMFNLEGFVTAAALARILAGVEPRLPGAFVHSREHNIYFRKEVPGLAPGHPALALVRTVNRTLCADELDGPLVALHGDPRLAAFLAATLGRPALFPMADPLAGVNVMAYGAGEALNWHFDRAEFTTTLLLRAPEGGGAFEYRTGLRSADDPNHDGVARLLAGGDPALRSMRVAPGTLNVFRGRDTAHRVTPVEGATPRVVAVLSHADRPGVTFSAEERLGFYGRSEPRPVPA